MSGYWRDTASQQAQDQLDGLLGGALIEAEGLVTKHGEFYPFALVWPTGADDAETLMVAGDDLDAVVSDSALLIERTIEVLRGRRAELDAVALVSDAYVNGQPAISVALEHRDDIHFTIFRYYRRKKLGRGYALGDLDGSLGDAVIWAD